MIDAARTGAGRMKPARHVLERRRVRLVRPILDRVPVDLEDMAERILEPESAAVTEIAVDPPEALEAACLDGGHAAFQRFR